MLPLVVIIGIIAIVAMAVGSVVLWLTGLLIAFIFFAIGVMFLYALHKMNALNVEEDRWLIVFPIVMLFVGFGFDKVGWLTLQPLSLTNAVSLSLQTALLWILVILVIVDIAVGLTSRE